MAPRVDPVAPGPRRSEPAFDPAHPRASQSVPELRTRTLGQSWTLLGCLCKLLIFREVRSSPAMGSKHHNSTSLAPARASQTADWFAERGQRVVELRPRMGEL